MDRERVSEGGWAGGERDVIPKLIFQDSLSWNAVQVLTFSPAFYRNWSRSKFLTLSAFHHLEQNLIDISLFIRHFLFFFPPYQMHYHQSSGFSVVGKQFCRKKML